MRRGSKEEVCRGESSPVMTGQSKFMVAILVIIANFVSTMFSWSNRFNLLPTLHQ